MSEPLLELSILNVAAHPHPAGIYPRLLEQVAGISISFWGSDHAAITKPQQIEEGLYQGRIVVWTQIDPNEPAIDIAQLKEVRLDETNAIIPNNVGFNGKVFTYTLKEDIHLIFVEVKNELGKNLSPRKAGKIFQNLFLRLPVDSPSVNITVVPEDDAIERILSLHRIDELKIHLTRPNAEEFGETAENILEKLEKMGAKSQEVTIKRAPEAETIKLDEEHEKMARVSAYHGWVSAHGRMEDGEKFDGSTREYPKIIRRVLEAGISFAVAARNVARAFRPPNRPGPDV